MSWVGRADHFGGTVASAWRHRRVLANQGYAVSGSDAKASEVTRRLETLGVRVVTGHAAEHVGDADVVVVSSAVRPTNP